jgi:hypothetical protein
MVFAFVASKTSAFSSHELLSGFGVGSSFSSGVLLLGISPFGVLLLGVSFSGVLLFSSGFSELSFFQSNVSFGFHFHVVNPCDT